MGEWKSNELNIVEFAENQPEELVFLRTLQVPSKSGDLFDVMEVKTQAGTKEHYFLSGHLRYLLNRNDVQAGDRIRVTYLGKTEAEIEIDGKKKKTEVNKYTLEKWVD